MFLCGQALSLTHWAGPHPPFQVSSVPHARVCNSSGARTWSAVRFLHSIVGFAPLLPFRPDRLTDRASPHERQTDRQAGRHQRAKTVTNSLLFSCSPRLRAPLCLRPRPKQNTVNHTTSALSLSCWLSVCVHLHLSATKTKSCQIHYERTLALRACTTSVCDQNKSRSFDKANTL